MYKIYKMDNGNWKAVSDSHTAKFSNFSSLEALRNAIERTTGQRSVVCGKEPVDA